MAHRFLVSLLFALFLNLPSLIEWAFRGANSPSLLSDWDESIYFPWMRRYAVDILGAILANDLQGLFGVCSTLLSGIPHFLLSAVLFVPAVMFDIPTPAIGLFGDLSLSFASFFLLSLALESVSSSRSIGFYSATVALACPYILRFLPDLGPNSESLRLVSFAHLGFPSVPVLRGPSTQLSYPFFLGANLIVLRRLSDGRLSFFWSAITGMVAGISIYCYFFSWLTLVVLIPILLVLHRQKAFKTVILTQLIPFLAAAVLVAAPALYGIMIGFVEVHDPYRIAIPLRAFYFSFTDILFGSVLWFLARGLSNRLLWNSILALFLTKFFVMNLQGILGKWLLPYHVPLFYTDSLVIGFTAILVLVSIENLDWRNRVFRFTIAPLAALAVGSAIQCALPSSARDARLELLAAVDSIVPRSKTLAVYSYARANLESSGDLFYRFTFPSIIETVTGRRVLLEIPEVTPYERVIRELLTSWIFFNRLGLLVPADEAPPRLSGELIQGVFEQFRYERYEVLKRFGSSLMALRLCDLLRDYRFEYVLLNSTTSNISQQDFSNREFFTRRWSSVNQEFHIFEFDYESALLKACS